MVKQPYALWTFAVALVCAASLSATSVRAADPVKVEITTRILDFDPQAGMKSTQTLLIDFDSKKISQAFKTGVTHVGFDIGSVRDKFVVDSVVFSSGRVGFTARGQTASGVMFMPNINYKFFIAVTPKGTGAIEGCHDGYPAYEVTAGGKRVYEFAHKSLDLVKLFGDCDIAVPGKNF